MADRVRCKAKNAFDNPMIFNHTAGREGQTTVQDGDEFSTEVEHADQLVPLGFAERIDGAASERSDTQARLKGAQTVADGLAITTNRKAVATPAPEKPKA